MNLPWVEKYRPKNITNLTYQKDVVNILKRCKETGEFTHMLFYGPPGTGKTSSITAFVNEIYGPKIVHKRMLELNASDERGINIVRNKIMQFAKTALCSPDPNYPCPPYKIIILDEADAMTTDAQSALRTIMETMSETTRFCFVCNYINQIITPIVSRCMKFKFYSIDIPSMNKILCHISTLEYFDIDTTLINKISELSNGDARRSISMLQYLYQYNANLKRDLTMQDIYDTTNYLPMDIVKSYWDNCVLYTGSNVAMHIINQTKIMKEQGYNIYSLLEQFKNIVVESNYMDNKKSLICISLCMCEKKLTDGADEYMQLLYILTNAYKILKK